MVATDAPSSLLAIANSLPDRGTPENLPQCAIMDMLTRAVNHYQQRSGESVERLSICPCCSVLRVPEFHREYPEGHPVEGKTAIAVRVYHWGNYCGEACWNRGNKVTTVPIIPLPAPVYDTYEDIEDMSDPFAE